MSLKIYTIEDLKADVHEQLFVMVAHGAARRAFSDLANDRNSRIGKHPGDYRLKCIGTFHEVTGTIEASEPENLGLGSEYVEKVQ